MTNFHSGKIVDFAGFKTMETQYASLDYGAQIQVVRTIV